MKIYVVLAVCVLIGISSASAADDLILGANLAGLLEYARAHNPELEAMRLEADAAALRIQPAAALPDPVLRGELMDITNQGTNKSTSLLPSQVGSTRYTLMQSVPWFGKRDLRRELAESGANQAQGRITVSWAELSAQIKAAYAQYYYVAGSQQITADLLGLVQQMEKVARVRYENGLAAQQDAVRAQVEQTAMKTGLIALENSRRQTEARLNALLSRPANTPFAAPQQLRGIPALLNPENHKVLENRILERNPDFFVGETIIRSAEKSRDLVYQKRYPDFLLGVSQTKSGSAVREWGVMVEFNIPLQQESRRSEERESEAMLATAKARKKATENRILSSLAENLSGLDAAQRTESLGSNGLLPLAKASFESALSGYQNGRVDFSTLLDAVRQILNARLEVLKARAEAQMRLAEIERLLGEEP